MDSSVLTRQLFYFLCGIAVYLLSLVLLSFKYEAPNSQKKGKQNTAPFENYERAGLLYLLPESFYCCTGGHEDRNSSPILVF